MKKVPAVAAVLAVLGVLARCLGPKMRHVDWEKRLEAMPDNARPKWMFRNIITTRENTDKILQLLESGQPETARPAPPPQMTDPGARNEPTRTRKRSPAAEGSAR